MHQFLNTSSGFDIATAVAVFWFRRDLRLHDNAGLYYALRQPHPVVPLFIFDTDILGRLEDRTDRRVEYIYRALAGVHEQLANKGSGVLVAGGKPVDIFRAILDTWNIAAVVANEDYEPYARRRDSEVSELLQERGSRLVLLKDHVIHAKDEVLTAQGTPFRVFTAYKKKWLEATQDISAFPSENYTENFAPIQTTLPPLENFGFQTTNAVFPKSYPDVHTLCSYAGSRDVPSLEATTRMGIHLRFGTVSVREMVRLGYEYSDTWLSELIWREFFAMVLYFRPDVVDSCYREEFNAIRWRNNEEEFLLWCRGQTGFPFVDAGMRQLNATGFMHNRARMAVASFLVKDLLVDWRWGEAYFAQKLLDYELASNNGNWQWVAGTGCDAAPYFRVFNPESQRKKFDPQDEYCRQWIPELGTPGYPQPMVDHAAARMRAISAYAGAVAESRAAGSS